MNKYLRRMLFRNDTSTERVNPLVWPFIFGTLLYGLGFLLLGSQTGVNGSSLYQALSDTHRYLPQFWGLSAALASFTCLTFMATRRTVVGEAASFFGFLTWFYAAWVYAELGLWLIVFTVAIMNGYFWGWLYLRTHWHKNQRDFSNFVDPQ